MTEIPAPCKAAVDAEYSTPSPFNATLTLPLKVPGLPADLADFVLYRILAPHPKPHGANFDKVILAYSSPTPHLLFTR